MKAYKPLIAAFLLTGSAITASSQSLEPFNPYGIFTPAVETTEMIRYGNLTPSLYTGAMTFSVPLYTYSDPDFKIPISLEYHFDGYRPGQHSGSVGYGWHLECGGAITREVRGFPDESDASHSGSMKGWRFSLDKPQDCELRSCSGSLSTNIDVRTYFSLISSYDPFSDIPAYFSPSLRYCKYDSAPDIYHFSFMGHSGDFYMNQQGEYVVFNSDIPEGEVKISVTGNEGLPEHFTITLGSGYKYEFFDYEQSITPDMASDLLPSMSNTGYRLSSITAPNERKVQFGYVTEQEISVFHEYANKGWGSVMSEGSWESDCLKGDIQLNATQWRYTEEFTKHLNSITVDGKQVITFNYETLRTSEFAMSNYQSVSREIPSYDWKSLALSSMSVKDAAGKEIEKTTFGHIQAENGTPKLFLTSVASRRNGTYTFSYVNANGGFPKSNTENTDHWGYWNNRNIDGQAEDLMGVLVAAKKFNGGGNVMPANLYDQVIGNYKNPDWTCAVKGALSTITYPTGGTTTVAYEANTATTRVNYNLLSDTTPFFERCSVCEAGGVRVKSLTDQIKGMPASITTFRYVDANDVSSGIICNMPRYCESAFYEHSAKISTPSATGGALASVAMAKFAVSGSAVYSKDPHVCYPSVYTKHPDGSETLNTFTSVLTGDGYKDSYSIPIGANKHVFSNQDNMSFSLFGDSSFNHFSGKLCDDRSGMRGKPLSTIVYDSGGRELQRTEYNYAAHSNTSPILCLYFNTPLTYMGISSRSAGARMMSKSESRDGLSSTGSYSYNNRGQISSESSFDGLDETTVHFQYVQDTAAAPQNSATAVEWGYDKQLSDAVKTKKENGANYIIAAEHYDYMDSGRKKTHPTAITSYVIDTPVSVKDGQSVQEMIRLLSSCVTRTTTFSYDSRERLVRVNFPGGAYITYSWTSDGKYIASKSVNADDNMIKYEWRDMVGLSKMQDATGQTETYLYDTRNRLMQRTDTNGNPTEKYYYHLKNE